MDLFSPLNQQNKFQLLWVFFSKQQQRNRSLWNMFVVKRTAVARISTTANRLQVSIPVAKC